MAQPYAQAGPPQGANYGQIGIKREPWIQWIMMIIPIYNLVHLCSVSEQLKRFDQRVGGSGVAAFFAFIPGAYLLYIPPIVHCVHVNQRINQAQIAAGLPPTCSMLKSVGGLFLFGTNWWHWQTEMNKVWNQYPGAATGTQVPLR